MALSLSLSRQALWCCTTSPSLPSLPLGCSLLLFDLHLLHHSTCLTFVINQSIHQSSWRGIRCNMSLSLLNEGILFSERERERERERESMLFLLFSCIQSKWVCYDTANSLSLSIVTLPTKHTMCVCVTLTLSALVEGRPCLVSKCPHATLHSSTTTTNNNTKHPSSSCSMIAREFFHHTHT